MSIRKAMADILKMLFFLDSILNLSNLSYHCVPNIFSGRV